MKRRTVFLLVIPALVVAACSIWVGRYYARQLPAVGAVDRLTEIDASMKLGDRIEAAEPMISISLTLGTAALLFAVVVLLHHFSTLARVAAWRERVFKSSATSPRDSVMLGAGLAVALFACGIMLLAANSRNYEPSGDEISYLEEAIEVRSEYGTAGFAAALYSGRWSERNRHPLYIWLLTPLASRSVGFFVKARLLTSFLAAASLAVVFLVIKNLFSPAAALLVLFFYGLNTTFLQMSSAIMCEVLLVSLIMGSFYYTVTGMERGRRLWLAGALAGLAYMTKLSGLFLPIAFFIAALVVWRLKAFRKRALYSYFIAFAVAASPLLVRNTIRFHNPFSNYNFRLLWLDKRIQTDTARFREGRTGVGQYLAGHEADELAERMALGSESLAEATALEASPMRSGYIQAGGSRPLPAKAWSGYLVLAVATVFLVFDVRFPRKVFAAVLAVVFFIPIAWYVRIAPPSRFIFPFIPIPLGYFAAGTMQAVGNRRWRAFIIGAGCLLTFWSTAMRLRIVRPFTLARPVPEAPALAEWLDEHMSEDELYLLGPDEKLRFEWYIDPPGRSQNIPITRNVPELVEASRESGAKYVVISRSLLDNRALQFSGYRILTDDGTGPQEIEGWRHVFSDPFPPEDFVVFEVLPENSESGR